MRVALITEGVSEYKHLPKLYSQLCEGTRHTIIETLKVNVAPDAEPLVLARECKSRLMIAAAKGAHLAIVVLDREQQYECPGKIAAKIEVALAKACANRLPVRVVLKDRAFENWLVADLAALASQPKRFKVTGAVRKKVEPNKADKIDAQELIKAVVVGGHYDKVGDSGRILKNYHVMNGARHSRSLRHFLHVLDSPTYAAQCRRP